MSLDSLKVAGLVVGVALVLVIAWQWTVTAHLIGWAACMFVLYRAWPALRADYVRLRTYFFPARSWRF